MPQPLTRLRTITEAAHVTGRPYRTIQTWARQGRITSTHEDGRVLVDLVEAARLSEQAGRRTRTA